MDVGEALLLGALALAGGAVGSAAFGAAYGSRSAERRAVLLGLAALALAALSWLRLLAAFLSHDYATYYVWNYSDESTPLYLRIAGTWAGAAGSLFLWTLLLGICFAAEEAWRRRARDADLAWGPGPASARAIILGVFAVFLFLTLRAQPFAPTADFHFDAQLNFFAFQPGQRGLPSPLDLRPQGFGLNPLLLTPFMAIHPPMEFAAYASSAMPFAFACAWLLTRDPKWHAGAIAWARWAWMFFAIAVGLGALWAYYVLSFGGYWVWDPVEVGDLIPLLGLTVFLHAADMHRKGKGWSLYAPLLAALALPLTLFGTFVTRSSYWISAHAFDVGTSAVVVDPAARLLGVLAAKPQVSLFVALLLVVLAAIASMALWRFARDVAFPRRRNLLGPALGLLGCYLVILVFSALDVGAFVRTALGIAGSAGRGDLLLGIALMGLVLIGAPVALLLWSLPEGEAKEVRAKDFAEPDALMSMGVALLSLGLLVTVALLLIGVNFTVAQLAQSFRDREPLVVVPLVVVLTMRLSIKTLGPSRSTGLALGTAALGAALYALLPESLRLFGLGVPILSVALGCAIAQLLNAAGKSSPAPKRVQRAGALAILSSLCGFAMWTSPPSSLALGSSVVVVPLSLVPIGIAASMAAFVLGIAAMQGERAPARLAPLAGLLAVGYGLGAVLALASLALSYRSAGLGSARPLRASLSHVRGRLHGASRWAAHLAILLVFVGYGASAYHATQADYQAIVTTGPTAALDRGVPRDVGGHALTLLDSQGVDANRDGAFEQVTALVQVKRGGQVLSIAPITFYWVDKESQYRSTEFVVRQPLGDLYLNSNPSNLPAMHTPEGWTFSNNATVFDLQGGGQMRSDAVDKLALSVKELPLVAPLWMGATLLPFTMAVTIATAPPRGKSGKPLPAAAPAPASAAAPAPLLPEPAPAPTRAEPEAGSRG